MYAYSWKKNVIQRSARLTGSAEKVWLKYAGFTSLDPTGKRYRITAISSWGSFQLVAIWQGHWSGDAIHKFCLPLKA